MKLTGWKPVPQKPAVRGIMAKRPGDDKEKFQPAPQRMRRQTGSLAVFLLLVEAVVGFTYRPVLDARAIMTDDHQYLIRNPLVLNPSWDSTRRFLTEVLEPSTVGGYYQPLAMISLMLDVARGASPHNLVPIHETSLALHLLNTALIVLLLYSLFGSAPVAALVGLLFGVHPVTVEPVPWISDRKTLLAALFSLASILAYVAYVRRRSRIAYAGSLLLFIAALLSKPTSTPLPVLLLLLDIWPLNRINRRAVFEKIPWLLIAAFSAWITVESQRRTANIVRPSDYGPGVIPLIVCHNIVFYLWKFVWPTNLTAFYDFPRPMSASNSVVLIGMLGTAALFGVLIASWRWTRALAIGWLFFFVAIFPTLGVIGFTSVIASDKYAYLPAAGILLIVAHFLTQLWTRAAQRAFLRCAVIGMAVSALAAVEILATRRYLRVWQTTESLYAHMIPLAPKVASLHFDLGYWHEYGGRLPDALCEYNAALALDLNQPDAHNNLGLIAADQGRYEEAVAHYRAALRVSPRAIDVMSNMALALAEQGKLDEAEAACEEALRIKPAYAPARCNLGLVRGKQGRLEEAVAELTKAIRVSPTLAEAHSNLAAAFWRMGRFADAAAEYEILIKLQPSNVLARLHHGMALAACGRKQEAEDVFQALLAIDPGNVAAQKQLELIRSGRSRS